MQFLNPKNGNFQLQASHSEWVEVDDEDEDEGEGGNRDMEEGHGAEMGHSQVEGEMSEEEEGQEEESEVAGTVQSAAALLRGEGKRLTRKERREEMERIRNELGLSDPTQTPQVNQGFIE